MEGGVMEELKKGYRMTVIIGATMILSVFIYALIVELIRAGIIEFKETPFKGFSPFPEIEILRYALLGVAAVEFFLIKFIRGLLLSGRGASASPAGGMRLTPKIQRLLTADIISYALCESIAIYGFVLFLLAGNPMDFYFFMAVSLAAFALYFPRFGRWQELVKEEHKT